MIGKINEFKLRLSVIFMDEVKDPTSILEITNFINKNINDFSNFLNENNKIDSLFLEKYLNLFIKIEAFIRFFYDELNIDIVNFCNSFFEEISKIIDNHFFVGYSDFIYDIINNKNINNSDKLLILNEHLSYHL